MANPRNYLIGLFALTTVGLAAVAWTQYSDLIKLRHGDTMASAERADWQKKLWTAEKRAHELEDEIEALRAQAGPKAAAEDPAAGNAPAAPDATGPNRPGRGPNGRFNNFQAVMNDPQFAKLMALQQKGMLDSRYAPLFKDLALTPAQLDQFKNLLLEKQNAMRDVLVSARDQGLSPRTDRDAINQLIQQSNAEIDSQIQSTLGPQGFAQYQTYEQTLPQRNTVNQLEQSLSYTSTPLTDAQANQLVQILAAAAPQNGTNPNGGLRSLFTGTGGTARVTDAAITQAQGVLSQPQIAALQQLQAQQQAQQQMEQLMRNSFRQQSGGSPSSTVTIAPNGTTTVTRTAAPSR